MVRDVASTLFTKMEQKSFIDCKNNCKKIWRIEKLSLSLSCYQMITGRSNTAEGILRYARLSALQHVVTPTYIKLFKNANFGMLCK